jgi:hypothetical protein
MNDFLQELLSGRTLTVFGASLASIGGIFWAIPRIHKGMFALRVSYAAKLRAEGEEERADRIDTETAIFLRRFPLYGKMMIVVGAAVFFGGVFRLI